MRLFRLALHTQVDEVQLVSGERARVLFHPVQVAVVPDVFDLGGVE